MDTNTFYGSRKRSTMRCTTLAEAQMEAEDCENPTSIIVLPPRSGDRHIDSDAEDVPEGFKDEI